MEKLTIEQKAKAYDKVSKEVKDFFEGRHKMSGDVTRTLEYLFPELLESEDERIRKGIIRNLEYLVNRAEGFVKDELKERIAWLEKQGGHKSTDKIQIGKEYKCIASPRYTTFMMGKIYKPEDKFLCNLMNFCSDCFEPKEDSEQIDLASNTDETESATDRYDGLTDFERALTDICYGWVGFEPGWQSYVKDHARTLQELAVKIHPVKEALSEQEFTDNTDKFIPKFNENEWVVQEGIGVYKVIEVCESWYEVVDVTGYHYSIGFDKEYMCHLWPIQDAQDGDILISSSKMQPFIFNGHYDEDTDYVYAYCGISDLVKDDSFYADENPEEEFKVWCTIETVKPATTEQRDFLFLKMKEVGYKWDSESKELIKIE